MGKRFSTIRTMLIIGLLCLLGSLAIVGCGTDAAQPSESGIASIIATPTLQVPTPIVDLTSARQAFDAGGELTYNEVIALRRDIVGDPSDLDKITDFDQYYADQDAFLKREGIFAAQLGKCTLKESTGWIEGWGPEYGSVDKAATNSNRLYVYMSNPFSGLDRDANEMADMYIEALTDKQIAGMKYGQRIQFHGDLVLADRHEAVENASYTLLDDDPPVPTPAPEDLKGLQITLTRTMCYGSCPDYSVSITSGRGKGDGGGAGGGDGNGEGAGKVTFEGHYYTQVKGTATANISQAELNELATEIIKTDYFSLHDSYREDVTDSPTHTLDIQMGGKSKQVQSYGTSPSRLGILMDRIDQIVNTEQWIGHDAPQ